MLAAKKGNVDAAFILGASTRSPQGPGGMSAGIMSEHCVQEGAALNNDESHIDESDQGGEEGAERDSHTGGWKEDAAVRRDTLDQEGTDDGREQVSEGEECASGKEEVGHEESDEEEALSVYLARRDAFTSAAKDVKLPAICDTNEEETQSGACQGHVGELEGTVGVRVKHEVRTAHTGVSMAGALMNLARDDLDKSLASESVLVPHDAHMQENGYALICMHTYFYVCVYIYI
jgi:hypothetical protein